MKNLTNFALLACMLAGCAVSGHQYQPQTQTNTSQCVQGEIPSVTTHFLVQWGVSVPRTKMVQAKIPLDRLPIYLIPLSLSLIFTLMVLGIAGHASFKAVFLILIIEALLILIGADMRSGYGPFLGFIPVFVACCSGSAIGLLLVELMKVESKLPTLVQRLPSARSH